VGISAHRDTESTGKTKVGKLEIISLVDQKILRLEIAMEDAM
jgi:hypothetical protein